MMPRWFAPALIISGTISLFGLLKQAKDKGIIRDDVEGYPDLRLMASGDPIKDIIGFIDGAVSGGSRLASGDILPKGIPLISGKAKMILQGDGNLVISVNGRPIWASTTRNADRLQMNPDGNLVLYSGTKALWNSSTHGNPGARFALGPDGNGVIYRGNSPIWASKRRPGKDGIIGSGFGIVNLAGSVLEDTTKGISRTAKKIPGLGHAIKAGEGVLKGSVGQTLTSWMRNPIVSTAFGPIMVPVNIANGLVQGGVRGATDAAKNELRNPIRRAAVKAVAVIFPPAAPGAVALEAANKLLDATEKGDAVEAAKAAAQIAANTALADIGDPEAIKTLNVIAKARDLRKASKVMATFSIPAGASKTKVIRAATALLTKAAAGNTTAKGIIKATATKAKTGDRKAVQATKVLAAVAKSIPKKPRGRATGRLGGGSFKRAVRAAKGKSFAGAYLVDSKGRVFKGTFAAK